MWASVRVLGIESTCDETAAAVVEADSMGRGKILSNAVLSQIAEHAAYGGVVPEIAAIGARPADSQGSGGSRLLHLRSRGHRRRRRAGADRRRDDRPDDR